MLVEALAKSMVSAWTCARIKCMLHRFVILGTFMFF